MGILTSQRTRRKKDARWWAKATRKWPKTTPCGGFTFLEMVVVVGVGVGFMLVAFAYLFGAGRSQCGCSASRISCVNNLKQMGTAYRIWANDNGDVFPAFAPLTNGGWKEYLARPNAGALCWTNYTIMQNELGQSAKVVVCPEDDRQAATNFNAGTFNNLTLSYFVGADANSDRPEALLGGDRNLTNLPPGAKESKGCGFSMANGLGDDVLVNSALSWTKAIHSKSAAGAGNILLGDGSVQEISSAGLTKTFLQAAFDAAEARAGATSSVGIRLIFP